MKFFARGLSWHCGDIHIMHDGTDITNKRTIHFLREHADFGKEFYAKGQEEITEEISADQKEEEIYSPPPVVEPLFVPDVELEKIYAQEQEDLR